MRKTTKKQMVLYYLRANHRLTSLEAINKWGVTRLAAIIHDLRKEGHTINTDMVKRPDRFGNECEVAQYKLIQKGRLF